MGWDDSKVERGIGKLMTKDSRTPRGWELCVLPDFTDVVMGQSPPSSTYNTDKVGLPFFQGKAEFGDIYPEPTKYCDSPKKIARAGATLLSVRAPVGPTNLANEECCIGRGLAAIHPLDDIAPMFVLYLMRSLEPDISKEGTGSTFAAINKQFLENLKIKLPPLNEQKGIVAKIEALFAELDAGVASLKKAQAQLKTYRQALLKHAFSGKLTEQWRAENGDKLEDAASLLQRIRAERQARYVAEVAAWEENGRQGQKPRPPKDLPPLTPAELDELPQLPAGWAWVKVGDISDIGTGVTPLKSRQDFYDGGTVPWVTSGSVNKMFVTTPSNYVTETALKETNLTLYPKHTLLVALYGEGKTRGKCSELLIEATTNQAIAAIVQQGTSAKIRRYLKWYFQKYYEDLRLKSSGGVQPNLNLGIIANTVFPMCSIQESDYLVEIIESKISVIDQLEQTITTALQQAEALRQSILKKAFSGQLVPQDPADEPAAALLAHIRAAKP